MGKGADIDMREGELMDKQPVFKHRVVHNVWIVVVAAKFKVSKHGGPLEEKGCSFRSFFVVEYVKGCEGCGAPFLYSSHISSSTSLHFSRLFSTDR